MEATNPCGEQWLGPYENCCLGSVNLNEHCGPSDEAGRGTVDWELLRQSVAEIKKTDRQGVIGRIKFDEGNQVIYGDDPTKTAVAGVAQWTADGKRVIVFPASISEGPIKLPEWVKK